MYQFSDSLETEVVGLVQVYATVDSSGKISDVEFEETYGEIPTQEINDLLLLLKYKIIDVETYQKKKPVRIPFVFY